MKMLLSNLVVTKTFKDKNRKNEGFCVYNIAYSPNKTEDDVPKQLQILQGNTYYIYHYSGKVGTGITKGLANPNILKEEY